MTKNTSSGKTPEMVTKLLKKEVANKSQSAVARESGIALYSVQRYLKGIGVPTEATFKKLSDYFGVSVWELREDPVEVKRYKKWAAKESADLSLDILKDLFEIYSIVPEKFKETLKIVIVHYRDEAAEIIEMLGTNLGKKEAMELEKVVDEADKLTRSE